MSEKFNFNRSFQLELLNTLMNDEQFLSKSMLILKDEFFENEVFGYFYTKMVDYYKRYEKKPDFTYFANEILKFEESKRGVYVNVFHEIINSKSSNPEYLKDKVLTFVKKNKFVMFLKQVPDRFRLDGERTIEDVIDLAEELKSLNFKEPDVMSFKDAHKLANENVLENSYIAPIGIPQIDNALSGGVHGGELLMYLGGPGIGKSIILMNTGHNSLLRGAKVLHFNLEGRRGIPVLRYCARAMNIPYTKVKMMNLTPEETKKYEMIREKYDENLKVVHLANFKVTVEDIIDYCKEIKKTFPFNVVIVDYGDLLSTRDNIPEFRHRQTAVFRGLSMLAAEYNVPVITASQATRPDKTSDSEKYYLSLENVCESFEKVRVASLVISINRTEMEEKTNKMRLMLCKNRDGESRLKVGCNTRYETMTPYSEECGFYDPINGGMIDASLIGGKPMYANPI